MNVEEAIEKSFRKLLVDTPYKKITVSMLCEDSDIARKTFYSHFDNKEDIISLIFIRDIVEPQRVLRGLLPDNMRATNSVMFHTKFYEAILADRDFYYRLVGPLKGVDDTFIRVASHAIYDFAYEVVQGGNYNGTEQEADYTAYFFATSQAMLIQKWISDGMTMSPEQLGALYQKLAVGYWKEEFAQ